MSKSKRLKVVCEQDSSTPSCAALNEAERHLASQSGIPNLLRHLLLSAEANCRASRGGIMAIATITDGGKQLVVQVPESYEQESLFHFLWDSLMQSGGECIEFAFCGDDDESLCAIYMDKTRCYVATVPMNMRNATVQLGDWRIQELERKESIDNEGGESC